VAFSRGIDGSDAIPGQPGERAADVRLERRRSAAGRLGSGTIACPRCDAPVAIGASAVAPSDALGCPFCDHRGAVRDFLSLAPPLRAARVEVRVVLRLPERVRPAAAL
jgi:hypothetical protein